MAARTKSVSRATARKIHLHIDNDRGLGEVFEVTPARLRAALRRHPDVARKLRITLDWDCENFEKHIKTADVLFGWKFDRRNLGGRAPNLRWVHAPGAGINHLMPLDWLPRRAVFTNNSGVHGPRAAEYAIMAILMLNNRVPEMVTNQRKSRWEQVFNTGIAGKTLLIVGVGQVGGSVAEWAKRFGLEVLGIRRTGRGHPFVDKMYKPADLRRVLPLADFVIVTTPATPHTRHMIGKRELDLMKKGAGLVNYSRADLVDYEALRRKLQRGELTAVLDVFIPEPLPRSSPLWKTPNLIITPHCSSDDTEAYTPRTLDLLFSNMRRFIAGKKLLNVVSRKYQY